MGLGLGLGAGLGVGLGCASAHGRALDGECAQVEERGHEGEEDPAACEQRVQEEEHEVLACLGSGLGVGFGLGSGLGSGLG